MFPGSIPDVERAPATSGARNMRRPQDLIWAEKYRRSRAVLCGAPEVLRAVEFLERFIADRPFFVQPVVLRNGMRMRILGTHCLPGWGTWLRVPLRIFYTVGRKGVYLRAIEPYDPPDVLELEITRGFG